MYEEEERRRIRIRLGNAWTAMMVLCWGSRGQGTREEERRERMIKVRNKYRTEGNRVKKLTTIVESEEEG